MVSAVFHYKGKRVNVRREDAFHYLPLFSPGLAAAALALPSLPFTTCCFYKGKVLPGSEDTIHVRVRTGMCNSMCISDKRFIAHQKVFDRVAGTAEKAETHPRTRRK